MRDKAKDKYKGIDIYSYYVLGIIEYGQTVHHIEPIKKNWNKRLDINNLIYLTESNHKKLHYRMDHGEEQEVIKELYELIKKFEKEMIN
ncbi:HNH endonuclease [Clostridium botulinum]|nr:HNH endonuclease [Clostridium botulinum]NEZ84001.1 HNH endonuclease [Clostridium botulinum]NFA07222.1 HNH endonuclease [Clostridium botulinum]NFA25917.1 HNH endonuclease [Clostridium botulinum]NFB80893.1 HNH endonuclease [Clostridium botulinum]NFB88699.1 HNH endonuclease [Clostridium botulinum]